jgi:hypothetical protein
MTMRMKKKKTTGTLRRARVVKKVKKALQNLCLTRKVELKGKVSVVALVK